MLLSELATQLNLPWHGQDVEILGVNTLADAKDTDLSFLANTKYTHQLANTQAGAVILTEPMTDRSCLISPTPYLDFVRAVQLFAQEQGCMTGISSLAFIHPQAQVSPDATIYPFVFIGENTNIGPGARIFSGCYIGEDCRLGDNVLMYPNCSLMAGTIVGNNVTLHAGVVLGSDGFGFAQASSGLTKFPQIGRTIIEDNVEIGANTTIDRAALGETRIGQGTKIDNLVQLGHNVQTGRNCILVAQVGIAGSTTLGDEVILAGQVGLAGHIHIGDKSRIGAKSGVGQDVPAGTDLSGIPAIPHGAFLRSITIMPKLPEMRKRITKLEKELATLKILLNKNEQVENDE